MTLYFIYDTCITSFYCRSVTTNRDSVSRVVWPLETMHWLTCWYVAWRVTCVLSSVLPKWSSFNWGFDTSKCNALFYCLSCLCTLASAGFPKCPPPRLYLPTDMNPGTMRCLMAFQQRVVRGFGQRIMRSPSASQEYQWQDWQRTNFYLPALHLGASVHIFPNAASKRSLAQQ